MGQASRHGGRHTSCVTRCTARAKRAGLLGVATRLTVAPPTEQRPTFFFPTWPVNTRKAESKSATPGTAFGISLSLSLSPAPLSRSFSAQALDKLKFRSFFFFLMCQELTKSWHNTLINQAITNQTESARAPRILHASSCLDVHVVV